MSLHRPAERTRLRPATNAARSRAGRRALQFGRSRYRQVMIDRVSTDLRDLVERLSDLAERRLATVPRSDAAATRARQFADHVRGHVRVRAASLDAPLVVLLVGPTGAGKSTIFNTLAARAASAGPRDGP
jgi:flagellar biosynthesis GTPase FlhF